MGVRELAGGQVLDMRLIRRTDHRLSLAELARLAPSRVLESDNGPGLVREEVAEPLTGLDVNACQGSV